MKVKTKRKFMSEYNIECIYIIKQVPKCLNIEKLSRTKLCYEDKDHVGGCKYLRRYVQFTLDNRQWLHDKCPCAT